MGDEKHARQRKKGRSSAAHKKYVDKKEKLKESSLIDNLLWFTNIAVGIIVMTVLAYNYSWLLNTLNENNFWFSNIKEVEREISFRTESGLYYSYYKQLVQADSLSQGLYALTQDNITEHQVSMNVLQRMNIYQEVFLAVIYRALSTFSYLKGVLEAPVFVYIKSVYGLHGALLACLYLMSWLISGSWLAGILTVLFYLNNRFDTTRVSVLPALRESFSLPFLWASLLCITVYFKPHTSAFQQKVSKLGLMVCTFFFSLFWQFNQFVLLLQSMALFGVQVLQLVPHSKIRFVYFVQLLSLSGVCLLQFCNTMIIAGPVFCFIPAALLVMYLQGERPSSSGVVLRIVKVFIYIVLVFTLMISFMKLIKLVITVDSDEHIYKFVLHKFGVEYSTDFDVNLYVCNGAFTFLSLDTFERLTSTLVFPLYAATHVVGVLFLVVGVIQKWRLEATYKKREDAPHTDDYYFKSRPELAYHLIQTFFFGVLAMTTLRMKYLWTPYMCVLASEAVCGSSTYRWLFTRLANHTESVVNAVRHTLTALLLALLLLRFWPQLRSELEDLREFYDPDTVELMEWINTDTLPTEALSGSMQLLAGVKLCTGRPITNHPHYEDKYLRYRTRQLYSMYARETAEKVHSILVKYNATYIILEDSICRRTKDRCALPTTMDIDMGILPDNPASVSDIAGLRHSDTPRFCDQVRHMRPPYNKYFKKAFTNKTFRVYKVLV